MSDCDPRRLQYGSRGYCDVPLSIAPCPECGAQLHVEAMEWCMDTDQPTAVGLYLECSEEMANDHAFRQSDWQPVSDAVAKWANAVK